MISKIPGSHTSTEFAGRGSLFDAFEAEVRFDDRTALRWIAISAAARTETLREQDSTLRSLADSSDAHFVSAYCIGCVHSQAEVQAAELAGLSDEDYSIVLESLARAQRLEPGQPSAAVLDAVDRFASSVRLDGTRRSATPFQRFASRLATVAGDQVVDTLAGMRQLISRLKQTSLHLVGPDLLSAFQALLDPQERLSEEHLTDIFALLRVWRLDDVATSFLMMRLLGAYDAERNFLRREVAFSAGLTAEGLADLGLLLDGPEKRVSGSRSFHGWSDRLIGLLADLKEALDRKSVVDVHLGIVRLYAFDPCLVEFLPWGRIHAIVDQERHASAEALVTTMLMGSRAVQRMWRSVAIRVGTGGFIGDLISFIHADARSDLTTLVTRFRNLPPPVASALTRSILASSVFERLAGAVAARDKLSENLTARGLDVHILRIEALRHAIKRNLLDKAYGDAEIAFEHEQARLQFFEHAMRSGRVRIPWEAVQRATKILVDGLPLDAVRSQTTNRPNSEVIRRVTEYFASEVVQYILWDSPVSIDQALSNNLRHGVLIPRFLRSFDDALLPLQPKRRSLPQWDAEALAPFFGDDAVALIELRDWLNDELKLFLDTDLTVKSGGNLDDSLRRELSTILAEVVASEEGRSETLEKRIATLIEASVKHTLAGASDRLGGPVRSAVFDEINRTRARLDRRSRAAGYLDSLEGDLHVAFDDVVKWIGVAENENHYGPFELGEVVKLELMTTHLASWRRLHVSTEVIGPGQSTVPAMIKGEYLDLFQDALHNLLGNAFKHSGRRDSTRVRVRLQQNSGSLVLSCENDISKDKLSEVQARHRETLEKARRPVNRPSKNGGPDSGRVVDPKARKDEVSGFLKMRVAFIRNLDREISITILPIGERRPRFTVELVLKNPPGIWHVDS